MTSKELLEYDGRRRRIQRLVKARGLGVQATISYDLRLPASQISNVLGGRYIDSLTLDKIEGWLETHVLVEA